MTAKQKLAVVLERAKLTERERESLVDMWDRIHRFNRCSDAQQAWIERIYHGQMLDREAVAAQAPVRRRVTPSWQKDEPNATSPMQAVVSSPAPPPMQTLEGPGIVKTNARQIMLRQNRQSGTFRIPVPKDDSEQQGGRVGYINYPGVQREELVTSLGALLTICPRIAPGSKQYQKIAGFFERGGVVLKVKPLEARVA